MQWLPGHAGAEGTGHVSAINRPAADVRRTPQHSAARVAVPWEFLYCSAESEASWSLFRKKMRSATAIMVQMSRSMPHHERINRHDQAPPRRTDDAVVFAISHP
jgi:hypothetical protein